MFEKYKKTLANPRESPLAPLKKGGIGLKSPCLVQHMRRKPPRDCIRFLRGIERCAMCGVPPHIKAQQDRGICALQTEPSDFSNILLEQQGDNLIVIEENLGEFGAGY